MKKLLPRLLTSVSFSLALISAAVMIVGAEVRAQCPPDVVAAGLRLPSGITQTPLGNLLVTENGTATPNTGRVSIVGLNGSRRTLLDGLPSGINEIGDISGPNNLFLHGRTLYVTIGQGDAVIAGPAPGTAVPNPNPSSPIYSSVLSIDLSSHAERNTNGFTLLPVHHQALKSGVKLVFGSGANRVSVELVTDFPDYTPNPLPFFQGNVRHSNPYGIVGGPFGHILYVADAGQNSVRRVFIFSGTHSTLTVFPPIPNTTPINPPPVIEAVPTGIAFDGFRLLVTIFRGFPFPPGASEVRAVNPFTGANAPFITGLTSTIDVVPTREFFDRDYLTLELSTNLLAQPPVPGRLRRFETPGGPSTVVSNCLISPSSMVLNKWTRKVYVTEIFTGRVVRVTLP